MKGTPASPSPMHFKLQLRLQQDPQNLHISSTFSFKRRKIGNSRENGNKFYPPFKFLKIHVVLYWTLAVPCAFTSLFSFYWNSSAYSGFGKLTQGTRLYQVLWINGSRDQQAQPAHSLCMWRVSFAEGRQTDILIMFGSCCSPGSKKTCGCWLH